MRREVLPAVKPSLEDIQSQFENWRSIRTKRGSIPEALWKAAVDLAGEYSINEISRALRVNYLGLKRRVDAGKGDNKRELTARFVEVDIREQLDSVGCAVEMEDQKGCRMKIYIKGCADLEGVVRAFWEKMK